MNPSIPNETILQKRDRLSCEIEELYKQSRAIENDVNRERFMTGLRGVAAAKGWLEVTRFEDDGFNAEVLLDVLESWGDVHPLMGCFELKDYHDGFDTDKSGVDGVDHVGVSHDDGTLSIRVRYMRDTVVGPFSLKRLLAKIGVPLKADHLKTELTHARRQVAAKEAEIVAVEAPIS